MTTYNTGNPVPSADARDRYDNSQTLDEVVNGDSASYTTRTGKQVISLGGMNSRFNNAQAERESEYSSDKIARDTEFEADQVSRSEDFEESQDHREATFAQFLDGSGWSSLGVYAAGISIVSHAQTVDYLGQPYSLKPSIPVSLDAPYITTGVWATEGVNFKLVGDNSLRQELAAPDGATKSGYRGQTVGAELDKKFKSAAEFFSSSILFKAGDRVTASSGEAWDISAAGSGEFNHPVAGYGVTAVLQPNGNLYASCYNVSSNNSAATNFSGIQLGLNRLSSRGAGILELPAANTANALKIAGRINIPGAVGMRGAAWFNTVLSFTTVDGGVTWDSSSILEDVDLRGNNIAQDGLMEIADVNRVSGRRIRIQDFTRYGLSVGMHGVVNNSLIQDVQVKFCGEANLALCRALNTTFLNVNTDLEMTSTLSARGLKVFDLFPGQGGNRMCRNSRFIGGIFERGAGDYQLEIEQADGLTFIGTEFNNGGLATARVRKGSATFFTGMYTLMGTNDILHADAGTRVSMYNLSSSGSGGKSLSDLIKGPVLVDGSLSKSNTLRSLRWYTPDKFGDATASLDPLTGCRVSTVLGGVGNRLSIVTTGGSNTAGTMRAYDVEIVVSKITSGSFVPHLAVNSSPNRIAGPALTLGVNRFSIITDLASSGSIDLIGSASADATILSAVVRSF